MRQPGTIAYGAIRQGDNAAIWPNWSAASLMKREKKKEEEEEGELFLSFLFFPFSFLSFFFFFFFWTAEARTLARRGERESGNDDAGAVAPWSKRPPRGRQETKN